MRIENITIKNGKLNFQNQKMEFNTVGIYLIRGANGSGKTTLLESILFDSKFRIVFDSSEEEEAYKENKAGLFSYVSQNIVNYNVTVQEFIEKGNKTVQISEAVALMEQFGLQDIRLDACYNRLSGGEKHKLAVISAILKDTPYLFLDEPTNHLDNQSVKSLCEYIESYSKDHTVVIVTHDPRIAFKNVIEITIEDNKISQENTGVHPEGSKRSIKKVSYKKLKFGKNIVLGVPNVVCVYLCFLLCVIMAVYNQVIYESGYCDDNEFYQADRILAYFASYEYDELNQTFAKAERLDVPEDLYQTVISNDEIPKLFDIDGVKQVMICDNNMFYGRLFEIMEGNTDEEIYLFNVPEDIRNSFVKPTGYVMEYFGNMTAGTYPEDYSNQICITQEIAGIYYDGVYHADEELIGQTFSYDGKEYIISGILDNRYDLCLVSYNGSDNYGYISADQMNRLEKDLDVFHLLIITSEEKEENVLKKLVIKYPAQNYISSVYQEMFKKQYNIDFVRKDVLPAGMIISLFFGVIIMVIKRTQMQTEVSVIKDYANYYLAKKQTLRFYILLSIVQIGIAVACGLIFNAIYSSYNSVNWYILVLDGIIAHIPYIVLIVRRLRK